MYEKYFGMGNTPFTRDIPVDRLYMSPRIKDALGRLVYAADRQMFAVVTASPGCGKSTLVRMFEGRLGREKYQLLYLSDSKLTPKWLYAGLLDQLGLEAHFYSGVSKRMLQKEIETVCTVQKKKVVCVLDEAHLLGKEMLEELRFLLNYKFDSESPMSLVLVGQTELWDQKLRRRGNTLRPTWRTLGHSRESLRRVRRQKYIKYLPAFRGSSTGSVKRPCCMPASSRNAWLMNIWYVLWRTMKGLWEVWNEQSSATHSVPVRPAWKQQGMGRPCGGDPAGKQHGRAYHCWQGEPDECRDRKIFKRPVYLYS